MTNMGTLDRAARLLVAGLLLALSLGTQMLGGIVFWLALAVAAIFVVTAFVGMCPLYRIFGLKTCTEC